jgi:hypothetical protein
MLWVQDYGTTASPPAPLLITNLWTSSLVAFRTAKTVAGDLIIPAS